MEGQRREGTTLPVRIAYLLEYPTLSGGERSLLTLLQRLDRERFAPLVLAPPDGRLAFALKEIGVDHVPFAVHTNGGGPAPRPVVASRVARILKRENADLLHANSLSMSFVSGRAADEAGIAAIGHVRDIQKLTRARLSELSLNRRVVCVSRATADNLLIQGLRPTGVTVIPNAVDPESFRPDGPRAGLREELLLPEHTPLLGSIGQICLRKGQNLLLRAFARVLEKVPDAALVCAGERHSTKAESVRYEDDLHGFVERRGLDRKVHFLGYRDDVPALLRDLDVFVHTAHQEPLGRVLLEASCSGLPIVATNVGGTREIIAHRETGLLVPPGKTGPLARGIVRLLRNEADRRAMGIRGRERTRDLFAPRDHAARIGEVYEAVLGTGA